MVPSTTSVASTSRKVPRKVPAMYAISKPTVEWTGSRFQVPAGAKITVSVLLITLESFR